MSQSNSPVQEKSSPTSQNRHIVLVLLHNLDEQLLDCDYFKELFSPYGSVQKVFLFYY